MKQHLSLALGVACYLAGAAFPLQPPQPVRLVEPIGPTVRLTAISDPLVLKFSAPMGLGPLKKAVSVQRSSGAEAPVLIRQVNDREFTLKTPVAGDEVLSLRISPNLTARNGAAYAGDDVLRIKAPPASARRAAPREPMFYGVNANSSPSFRPRVADAVKDLGVGFARTGWAINGINPNCLPLEQSGSWSWQSLDRALDRYAANRTKVVLILLQTGTTRCSNGGRDDPTMLIDTPERYTEYVEGVARHVLRRHPGLILAFELGNEPDQPHFWKSANPRYAVDRHRADAYFAYLKPSATALRRVLDAERGERPAILNGGFGGGELDWWRSLVSKPGFGDLVDGLNIHIYPWAGASPVQAPGENDLANLRREAEIAQAAGLGGKPFWVTETALQSLDTCVWSVDEQSQARMMTGLVDHYARSTTPRIKAIAWFTIQDDERDRRRSLERDRQPGVCYAIYGLGLIDVTGRRRPAFDTYRQIIALSKANTSPAR